MSEGGKIIVFPLIFSFNNMKMNIDKEMFNNYMNTGYNQFKEYYETDLKTT